MSKKPKKPIASEPNQAPPANPTPPVETPVAKTVENQPIERAIKSSGLGVPYWEYIALVLVCLFYTWVRSGFWTAPMERDEGIYAYFGQLILDGKVPYIDFYESRLPGIFYMYAILVGIFGAFKGLAVAITLLNLGSAIFLFHFARSRMDNAAAVVVAVAALFLGLAPEISGYTRQSEHLVVFWLSGGLFFLQRAFSSNRWQPLVWAGVFMCLSMLTKPNGVFFILMGGGWVLSHYLFDNGANRVKTAIVKALIYSAAVFGTFGLLCLWLLMQGALDDMWYWVVTYSADYAARIPWAGEPGSQDGRFFLKLALSNITKNYMIFWVLAALGMVVTVFVQNYRVGVGAKINLFMLAIFSFLSVVPSMAFYGHYWIMVVPALAIAIGSLFHSVSILASSMSKPSDPENVTSSDAPMFKLGGLAVFMMVFFYHFQSLGNYYLRPKLDQITRTTYGTNPFVETVKIGDFLKPRLSANDQIALIGSEPQLYVYTGARSASKHAYFSYLVNDTTKTKALEWQREFQMEVEAARPKYLIFFRHPISLLVGQNASQDIFVWYERFIATQNYRLVGAVDRAGRPDAVYYFGADQVAKAQISNFDPQQQIFQIFIFERGDQAPAPVPVPTPTPDSTQTTPNQ